MSLEKIEQHIKELEALKYYSGTKQERDEALKKVGELESVKTELEKRIADLEQIKVTSEGKTIKEAEEAFLRAEQEEISRKAEEKSNEKYEKWRKDEKPKEVFDSSVKELKTILQSLSEAPYQAIPSKLAQAGLDVEVKKALNVEVQKRLHVEFNKRVEARAHETALKWFENWKKSELNRWHNEKIMPEIARLETVFSSNIMTVLRDTDFEITCNKCDQISQIKFTGQMISNLITKGKSNLPCINPNCNDPWTGRHQIQINLADLIDSMITLKSGYP
ncbi:MAG: hypothetical protein ABSB40_04525 [Nitrososphaeria archaeon]|jgi:hypothetical protein